MSSRLQRLPGYLNRRWALRRAVSELKRTAPGAPPPELLRRLIAAWGSPHFTADEAFASSVATHAASATGPILECGSGLTTVIAAVYGRHGVWSLEHLQRWHRRARSALRWNGLRGARVSLAPLVAYERFDWYDVASFDMPTRFALVICDGPPGATRGGRVGLLPVMGDRLAGATILLDDAQREGETTVLDVWSRDFGVTVERPSGARYAVVRLGDATRRV